MGRLSKLSRSIAGKVAIVTGAGSGMGRATASPVRRRGRTRRRSRHERGRASMRVVAEIDRRGRNDRRLGDRRHRRRRRSRTGARGRRALRRHRHPRQQRRRQPSRADRQRRYSKAWERTLAVNLTAHDAADPRLPAAPRGGAQPGAWSTSPRPRASARPPSQPVHGEQARRDRSDACVRGRAGLAGRHRQLRLPGPDPHRHDRARSPTRPSRSSRAAACRCAATASRRRWRTRRSAWCCRRLRTSTARCWWWTAA